MLLATTTHSSFLSCRIKELGARSRRRVLFSIAAIAVLARSKLLSTRRLQRCAHLQRDVCYTIRYMSSPEGRGGQPAQPGEGREPNKEQEHPPYSKAARFAGAKPAAKAYFEAQEVIFNDTESDLSAYRLMLNTIYHVAVMGEQPSADTDQAITQILSQGKITTLPPEASAALNARRLEMKQHGSWVEGHYRPGKRLDK